MTIRRRAVTRESKLILMPSVRTKPGAMNFVQLARLKVRLRFTIFKFYSPDFCIWPSVAYFRASFRLNSAYLFRCGQLSGQLS